MDKHTDILNPDKIEVDKSLLCLCAKLLGAKRLEIIAYLCQNIDKYGLIKLRIKDIEEALDVSKPTILSTFALLSEKKLFSKLKNGFYRLHTDKFASLELKLNKGKS